MLNLFLLILTMGFHPVSVMEIADLNAKYPEVDMGIGIGYGLFVFENQGYVRFGPFVACDLNPDLSRPDWGSIGLFLAREIQYNVTIGCGIAYRFGELDGLQGSFFLGIDIVPWLK